MKKILIIEDDETLREALKISLTTEGFNVNQATDGEEGLQKIKSEKPDLILLDLVLPKKDGYHILYELQKKKWFENTPIIVLTVIDSDISKAETLSYGAIDYVIKSNLTIKEVIFKVKKVLSE